jgi:hypothetical protein
VRVRACVESDDSIVAPTLEHWSNTHHLDPETAPVGKYTINICWNIRINEGIKSVRQMVRYFALEIASWCMSTATERNPDFLLYWNSMPINVTSWTRGNDNIQYPKQCVFGKCLRNYNVEFPVYFSNFSQPLLLEVILDQGCQTKHRHRNSSHCNQYM